MTAEFNSEHQRNSKSELPQFGGKKIDSMHQCCLGVVMKLILTWMGRGGGQGRNLGVRLSAGQTDQISGRLEELRQHILAKFARQPRGLYEADRWKAMEFILFLYILVKLYSKIS